MMIVVDIQLICETLILIFHMPMVWVLLSHTLIIWSISLITVVKYPMAVSVSMEITGLSEDSGQRASGYGQNL